LQESVTLLMEEKSGQNMSITSQLLRTVTVRGITAGRPTAASPALSLAQLTGLSTYDKPASQTVEKNEFYDKYKAKIDKLKQENPEKYSSAVEQVYKPKKPETKATPDLTLTQSAMQKAMGASARGEDNSEKRSAPERKGLNSIMKLEMLKNETPENITKIWNAYHGQKDNCVFAVIPAIKYQRLRAKGTQHPTFIYAVPREQGFEFMLGQCSVDDWYYTPLVAYQAHQEYAPYSLAIRYYTELIDSKGLVLMLGEIASDDLKPELATLLVHQTTLFYGSDENFRLVETMNKQPSEFKHMDVVDICKRTGFF